MQHALRMRLSGSLVVIRNDGWAKLACTASDFKNQENTDSVSTLCHRLHSFIDSGFRPFCNRFDDDPAWSAEF